MTTATTETTGTLLVRWGACAALVGVALGAFGAHALQENLHMESHYLDVWKTGVQYHLIHALALVLVGFGMDELPQPMRGAMAGRLFFVGILIFGGSLYALALTSLLPSGAVKPLGAITPLGGVCFLTGWAFLAASTFPKKA